MTTRTSRSGLRPLTVALLSCSVGLAVLHHVDHVLRYDHSGWPFRPEVTTFSYSLLVYPVVLFGLLGPASVIWLRWATVAAGTLFVLYAHIAVETPSSQFTTWAHNHSTDPAELGAPNLLGVESPALGVTAATLSLALNVTAILATAAMLRDCIHHRGVTTTRTPR